MRILARVVASSTLLLAMLGSAGPAYAATFQYDCSGLATVDVTVQATVPASVTAGKAFSVSNISVVSAFPVPGGLSIENFSAGFTVSGATAGNFTKSASVPQIPDTYLGSQTLTAGSSGSVAVSLPSFETDVKQNGTVILHVVCTATGGSTFASVPITASSASGNTSSGGTGSTGAGSSSSNSNGTTSTNDSSDPDDSSSTSDSATGDEASAGNSEDSSEAEGEGDATSKTEKEQQAAKASEGPSSSSSRLPIVIGLGGAILLGGTAGVAVAYRKGLGPFRNGS